MKAYDEMSVGEKARLVGNLILAGRPVDAARLEIVGVMRAMAKALDDGEAEIHRVAGLYGVSLDLPRRAGARIVADEACKWEARLAALDGFGNATGMADAMIASGVGALDEALGQIAAAGLFVPEWVRCRDPKGWGEISGEVYGSGLVSVLAEAAEALDSIREAIAGVRRKLPDAPPPPEQAEKVAKRVRAA